MDNQSNKKFKAGILRYVITVFSCVMIIVMGAGILAYASATTIGENIITNILTATGLTVSGNATTTGTLNAEGGITGNLTGNVIGDLTGTSTNATKLANILAADYSTEAERNLALADYLALTGGIISGDLTVSGTTALATTTMVTTTISGDLTVSGVSTFLSNVSIDGDTELSSINGNTKYVKSDETIQSVIDSITDATETNPYTVMIPPRVYDYTAQDLIMKEWVHLRGSGVDATKILTHSTNNIIAISNSSISDMTIEHTHDWQGAITKNSLIQNFVIDRVNFNIYDSGAAISFLSGGDFLVYMNNVRIVTEGKGIHTGTSGAYYLHDVDIFLTGDNIGGSHIGIQVDGLERYYIWGSKIGTGYGYPTVINDADQDVIGIYIPVSEYIPRIELHGLESFCRNENAQTGVKVNVLRAEAGWFRCFGCFGQSETPPDWSVGETLYQSGDGKIEVKGCRFSSCAGNIFGSPQRGVSQYTTADHLHALNKFEGGLILLNATDGAFTFKLTNSIPVGDEYIFKKIDSTANVITISGNGHTIDGQASVALNSQYETLKIIGGVDEWVTY